MKVCGICTLVLIVGAAALVMLYISNQSSSSFNAEMVFVRHGDNILLTKTRRKLKEGGNIYGSKYSNAGNLHLDDYDLNDPVPSSKAAVKPGPIEHGTPVIPYIPKPSPPNPTQPSAGWAPTQSSDDIISTQPSYGTPP